MLKHIFLNITVDIFEVYVIIYIVIINKEIFEMAKSKSDYFGLPYIVSVICAIIPVTAWLFGALTRIMEGKIIAGIIRLIGLGFILWVVDLILMVLNKHILRLLPI